MRVFKSLTCATGLLLLLGSAAAQSVNDLMDLSPEERRAYMQSMSDDERSAMREKWRNEMQNMSEEERQAIRDKRGAAAGAAGKRRDRGAMRERWESMSEEERAAAKEQRTARKAQRKARWDAMSEEERAAAREKRQQHKGNGKRHSKGDRKRAHAEGSDSQ